MTPERATVDCETLVEARQRVAELSSLLQEELGANLLALYLFGSLAAGRFHPSRSDLDLFAVVETGINGDGLASLEVLLARYVAAHPAWDNRIEVGFVGRAVLQTFADSPAGSIVVVSPGEPLHAKEVEVGWLLNWYSVCTQGEVLYGVAPLEVGPALSVEVYKREVAGLLPQWRRDVRERWVAHSRSYQGYIVIAVCRALYGLDTGQQTTKEEAAAWAAERFPEWADFINEALLWHRSDLSEPHATTIRFVDFAVDDVERKQND